MTPDDLADAGLRVKTLEWHQLGPMPVWKSDWGDEVRLHTTSPGYFYGGRTWASLDAAREAAQEGHVERILAALTPAPVVASEPHSTPVDDRIGPETIHNAPPPNPDVAGLIERATELAETFDTMMEVQRDPTGAWMAIQELEAALRAMPADPVAGAARVLLAAWRADNLPDSAFEAAQDTHNDGDAGNANDTCEAFLIALAQEKPHD